MDFRFRNPLRDKEGFTLVELLIVVAIIGILAAIAIPQFSLYRQNAFDAAAKSDLANLAQMQDYYFIDSDTYTANLADLTSFSPSDNVTITILVADKTSWKGTAKHSSSSNTFTWDSSAGGMQ